MGGRRHVQHPDATQARLYEASRRPNPWQPARTYRILLRYRDGTSRRCHAEDSLEKAREEVQRFFDFDTHDALEGAWIFEEVRC